MLVLFYFYQILTDFNKSNIMLVLFYFYQILTTSNYLRVMSEVAHNN
jgi:hypothetical protein